MNRVPNSSMEKRKGFFEKHDPWGHGVALWVVAAILFLAPLAVSSLRHVKLDNDVENWLPENDPSAQEYLWCRDHFPEEEKVILTWEGSTPTDQRLPVLVGQLMGKVDADGQRRGGIPYVNSVVHAGDVLKKMIDFGVDEDEARRRIHGIFLGAGHVKVCLTDAGRTQKEKTIGQLIAHIQKEFGIDIEVYPAAVNWTPVAAQEEEFDSLYSEFVSEDEEDVKLAETNFGLHDFQIGWSGISRDLDLRESVIASIKDLSSFATADEPEGARLVEDAYLVEGSPIAVVVTLSDAGVAEKSAAISTIRQVAINSMIPDDGLIVGGRVVAATELNKGVIRAAWNPTSASPWTKSVIGLSGLVGILFALISLRSFRLGILVVGVSYYAALLGVSLIPLSGGSMNMVLIVMPTLLMVLALSGAIHVANYWKHAVWEDPKTAVATATKIASQPCLMAAFTTSLGLISLLNSDLIPVREFGIYAAIGCLISVAMVLYGLPALLQMVPLRRVAPDEIKPRGWTFFSSLVCKRWLTIGALTIIVAIACSVGLMHFDVETKVIRYFPDDSQVVQDYRTIEDNLAGISPVEILVRFDEQAQTDLRFLERLELVRKIEDEIRNHPEVSGAVSLAAFMPVREIPDVDASTRVKILFNRRSNTTEKRIKEEHASETGDFITMDQSKTHHGDELWRINSQAAVLSDADYNSLTEELSDIVAQSTKYHAGVEHVVTGTVPLFLRTQRAVLDSLIRSSLVAFGLIAAVMIWVLRDPIAGMVSMIPNILPVVAIFGLVSWFGQKIDIGTMVTASVAMGIAVDGTLHLLTWFRNGLRKGLTREESITQALLHCGPAMWQTSAAVGIGLLVLFPADLLLISRFGWLMASLIGAAFIGDMVLLPCMLVGPLGALVERRVHQNGEVVTPDDEDDQAECFDLIPAPHIPLIPSDETKQTKYVG